MNSSASLVKSKSAVTPQKTIAIDARMWGPEFTGIGSYEKEVGLRLFRLLADHRFVVFTTQEKTIDFKRFHNVETVLAPERIYSASEQFAFSRKLRKSGADVTWFPHFNVPLLFRGKFVVTIHDLTILKFPGKKMNRWWHLQGYKAILRHSLKRSQKIIAVSDFTAGEIQEFMPSVADKIEVVQNGVNIDSFSNPDPALSRKWRENDNTPIFLVAGVWREHKNVPGAMRAYELYRKHGGKGKLIITGRADPFYPEVENLRKQSQFTDDIVLTGFLDEKEKIALLAAADVLIFPSFAEGFGLPALEAMAAGTPVICSNQSSLPEVCGDAALFFEPHDAEDIALKMVDALEDHISADLIRKGKQRIQQFSWDTAAGRTAKILTQVVESQS